MDNLQTFKTDAFKYQQIKNTCTYRIKYFPTRNSHQRLKNIDYAFSWMASTPAQQAAGGISAAKDPTRALEPRWGGGRGGWGRPFEGNRASKQVLVVVVSATVLVIRVCLCTACERHLAFLFLFFLFLKRLISAPRRRPGLLEPHLKAAGSRPHGEAFPPRTQSLNAGSRLTTGSKSAVWR